MHIEFQLGPEARHRYVAVKTLVEQWNVRYNYTYSYFYLDGYQLHFSDPKAYTMFALTWNLPNIPFKVIP